jgi:hypothetical protein
MLTPCDLSGARVSVAEPRRRDEEAGNQWATFQFRDKRYFYIDRWKTYL